MLGDPTIPRLVVGQRQEAPIAVKNVRPGHPSINATEQQRSLRRQRIRWKKTADRPGREAAKDNIINFWV